MKNGGFRRSIGVLFQETFMFPNFSCSQACGVAAGQVLLLVPRIGELGQRNFAAVRRGGPRKRDFGSMGQKLATDFSLHSNFDHIVHIISYIII